MSEMFKTDQSTFKPGKKLPLLGMDMQTSSRWVRWGLPVATGLAIAVALSLWYLS
jgi:hypothetical protein